MLQFSIKNDITAQTQMLAEHIDSEYEMLYIPIIPFRDSKPTYCYMNVNNKIKVSKGTVQYGWLVTQTTFTVEAIHHAVWQDSKGNLIDVTPSPLPLENTLFIPDDRIKYDGRIIDSIKINITSNEVVNDFIAIDSIKNAVQANTPQFIEGSRKMKSPYWFKYKTLGLEVTKFLLEGNDQDNLCYCNSGSNYRHCHGQIIKNSLLSDKGLFTDTLVQFVPK